MALPPTELPCTGTLTTFEPITRLDNATYCAVTGGIIYMILSNVHTLANKYQRAVKCLSRADRPLPNMIIIIEFALVAIWISLLIGDLLNSTCNAVGVSYSTHFALSYMTLHSFYLSQITLFTARILTICRNFATLTVPRGISYIEQVIVLKSIISPIVFAIRTFGVAGNQNQTWGNYNEQWMVEVGITIGILLVTIASAAKLELIKDKRLQTPIYNIAIMLIEPFVSMVFDLLESGFKVWIPPMTVWKVMEFLILRTSFTMTTRLDRTLHEKSAGGTTGTHSKGPAVSGAPASRIASSPADGGSVVPLTSRT
ncbi:unnamed protein product (mitochondrion) [Plasmodiophora brassicae]|uniref:Uncharacterized protein n=1 Tax=Plasmodiophora brassicae TaxID=37360 RepID=A0A0G4IXG1_PLABS|nr:hypothetical protein PBRA_007772 [Plasmodiophora brassicae]SPQ99076.1 unnamed protein product [Plasmodiophora brassicae]